MARAASIAQPDPFLQISGQRRRISDKAGSDLEVLELNEKSGQVLADDAAGPEADRRHSKG
jgi:hypothetical protein